jgi:AraC family transcriptional regulator
MTQLQAICEALDFVEGHLVEDITVGHMAEAAGYSVYHFTRTFNRLVHHTPYAYLIRRRLSESAQELLAGERRIIDVAFDYQFNSPETYSRAFKRMFDVQPSQWAAQGTPNRSRMIPPLTREYLTHINQGHSLKPTRETLGPLHLVGLMTLAQGTEHETVDLLWETLAQAIGREDAPAYALTWYPEGWETRGAPYLAALARREPPETSAPLMSKTLPPLTCARFTHRGTQADLRWTRAYVYHTWMPLAEARPARALEIEAYGIWNGCNEPPSEWALYIPLAEERKNRQD